MVIVVVVVVVVVVDDDDDFSHAGLSAIEFLEAILFAVRQVNRERVIPGVTLGVYILDDCFSASLSLMRAIQFMPTTGPNHAHDPIHANPEDHSHVPPRVHSEDNVNLLRHGHAPSDVQSQDQTHSPGLAHSSNDTHCPERVPVSPDRAYATDHVQPRRSVPRHYPSPTSLLSLYPQNGGSPVSAVKAVTAKPARSDSLAKNSSEDADFPVISATTSTKNANFSFPFISDLDGDGSDISTKNESIMKSRSHSATVIPNEVAENDGTHSDVSKLLKTDASVEGTTSFQSDVTSSNSIKPCKTGVTGGITTPYEKADVMSDDMTTSSKPDLLSKNASTAETSQMLRFFEVAGVIGAFTSQHSIEVAKVLEVGDT